jgi:hypothetical protein
VLAKKGSILMSIFRDAQHDVYDGGYITHAISLLSDLCWRLADMPYEVLILDKRAFTPSTWRGGDMEMLFKIHNDTAHTTPPLAAQSLPPVIKTYEEALAHWRTRNEILTDMPEWATSYTGSYVIHAFDNFKKYANEITLEYILARQSNFACAVYPAIRHAIVSGVITSVEDFSKQSNEAIMILELLEMILRMYWHKVA